MKAALALALALLLSLPAFASEPTEKDAIALVERAAAMLKSGGKEELIKKIAARDPELVKGTLYVDIRDLASGVVLAHPINPAIVGADLLDVPDANGKKYRREILDVAQKKGKGWVDYHYRNPASGKVEPKTTYVLRVGDAVLEAGIYKK